MASKKNNKIKYVSLFFVFQLGTEKKRKNDDIQMGVREEKKTRVGEISTIWEKGARVKREKLPFDWESREKLLSKRKLC